MSVYCSANRGYYIGVDGLDYVTEALGDLRRYAPAVSKVAINKTARQARKLLIAKAKARYALTSSGKRHLNDLKVRRSATNSSLAAELFISKMRSDLGYFDHTPKKVYTGATVLRLAPEYHEARVLADSARKPLTGKSGLSKGFLAKFESGHIGMVQRVIGSRSSHTETRNGHKRWKNKQGNVEKVRTMGAPSAAAQHRVVFPDIQDELELYLVEQVESRILWTLERYG